MRKPVTLLIVVLSLCYPFIIYWGLKQYDAKILLPVLLILLAMRWLVLDGRAERKIVVATIIGVAVIIFAGGSQLGLKFYPVMMNLGFFVVFASSLFSSMSFVERIARIKEGELPPHAVTYTRKVTWAWSIFFLINGTIATYTALWASDEIWMMYNGMIAYFLMGLLAGGEWLIRQKVKRGSSV